MRPKFNENSTLPRWGHRAPMGPTGPQRSPSESMDRRGSSVPTGFFGALWAQWGPCGPLRGPLVTMRRDLCHSPLNFGRMYSIWIEGAQIEYKRPKFNENLTGPRWGRRAPMRPTGPQRSPSKLMDRRGSSVPTGSFGALWASWGPAGPIGAL